MQLHYTKCFGGPNRTNCPNDAIDGYFCRDCRESMKTPTQRGAAPVQPIYTACVCGEPVWRDGLCETCHKRESKRLFR